MLHWDCTAKVVRTGAFIGLVLGLCWTVALCDETPQLTLETGDHTSYVTTVRPLPDGRLLTGSFDKTIRVWDLASGESTKTIRGQILPGRYGQINDALVTRDGGTLVVGGWFNEKKEGAHPIRLYDWPQGTVRGLLTGHERPVMALAISPDNQFLASGDFGGTLRLWHKSGDSFVPISVSSAHADRLSTIRFDPTGNPLLITAGYDGVARYWQYGREGLRNTKSIRPLTVPFIYDCEFRPGDNLIAFGGARKRYSQTEINGEIRFYDRQGTAQGKPYRYRQESVACLEFSPEGRRLAVGFGFPGVDYRCIVYSYPDGEQLSQFAGHNDTVFALTFLPDGKSILSSGGYDNAVRRWDASTGQELAKFGGRTQQLWNVAVSTDGRTVLWGDSVYDSKARFGIEKHNDRGPLRWGLRLGESPTLVSAAGIRAYRGMHQLGDEQVQKYDDGRMELLKLVSNEAIISSGRNRDVVYGATFLPWFKGEKVGASKPLVVAGSEALMLYDAADGRRVYELKGHSGAVRAVAPSPLGDFVATAGADQTVRLWHLATGELRLSMFQAGVDWIAWTPNGYYAASPQGDRLIGWQVNQGEGHDPLNLPADRFRKTLHRPEILQRVFDAEGPLEPGRGIDDISQLLPPEVRWVQPEPPANGQAIQLTSEAVVVRAIAQSVSRHPVKQMRLLVNGRPYRGNASLRRTESTSQTTGPVQATWNVSLPTGAHELSVIAETDVSKSPPSDPLNVRSVGASLPDGMDKPRLFVLAIGIGDYGKGIQRLRYPAKDATAVAEAFRSHSNNVYQSVDVELLTDKQVTRSAMTSALSRLRKQTTQRDVSVIFFSGHGQRDANGDFYLLPVDVDTDNLLGSGVSGETFKKALRDLPGRVITMLDACHSGVVAGDVRKSIAPDDLYRDLVNDDHGVVVMASSMGREFSGENNQYRHGHFTQALLEALEGKADFNGDGFVYLKEMDSYVTDRVRDLSNGEQHPATHIPAVIRSFPVAQPVRPQSV